MLRWLVGLCVVAGIAVGILLGALNPDPVQLDLGIWLIRISLGAIVAGAALCGFLAGLLFALLLGLLRPGRTASQRDLRVARDD